MDIKILKIKYILKLFGNINSLIKFNRNQFVITYSKEVIEIYVNYSFNNNIFHMYYLILYIIIFIFFIL